jgi:hypothetical protein
MCVGGSNPGMWVPENDVLHDDFQEPLPIYVKAKGGKGCALTCGSSRCVSGITKVLGYRFSGHSFTAKKLFLMSADVEATASKSCK